VECAYVFLTQGFTQVKVRTTLAGFVTQRKGFATVFREVTMGNGCVKDDLHIYARLLESSYLEMAIKGSLEWTQN